MIRKWLPRICAEKFMLYLVIFWFENQLLAIAKIYLVNALAIVRYGQCMLSDEVFFMVRKATLIPQKNPGIDTVHLRSECPHIVFRKSIVCIKITHDQQRLIGRFFLYVVRELLQVFLSSENR